MLTTAQQIDAWFEGYTYNSDLDEDIYEFSEHMQPSGIDQDWKSETTTYTFRDSSKLIVGDTGYEVA